MGGRKEKLGRDSTPNLLSFQASPGSSGALPIPIDFGLFFLSLKHTAYNIWQLQTVT